MAKQSIKTMGMIVKPDEPEALALAKSLTRLLRRQHKITLGEQSMAQALGARPATRVEIVERADLIVVLGGDGTLLSVARIIGRRETPILGINLGGLGFLTEVTTGEAHGALEDVLAGKYYVDWRITLEAEVAHGVSAIEGASAIERFRALNDVVLNKGPLGRMMQLEVSADHKHFCTYRADGLIVATPTGSTAYALSAGGPIVFPSLDALVLAPICPHTLSNRPVVLPDRFEIEVRVTTSNHDAMLTADGQESTQLSAADRVRIRRGKYRVALVRSAHPSFEIWRDKLRWG